MQQFTHGFGNIFYDGALLTLTEIAHRKKDRYTFNPAILKHDEINRYFQELSQLHPLRERFIIAHMHWNIGEIVVDDKNHAQLLIIDSLGNKLAEEKYFLKEIIHHFSKHFQNHTIYVSKDLRQNSPMGCSIFALDDLRHLYTVETYLPKVYSGLFDYLKKTSDVTEEKKITIENKTISYFPCQLPLSLERTRQNENLLTIISQRHIENIHPINKRKDLAKDSAIQEFVEVKNKKGILKRHNKRLENQLLKMAKNNEYFLLHNSINMIKEYMQTFTLSGLRKRLSTCSNSINVIPDEMKNKLKCFLQKLNDFDNHSNGSLQLFQPVNIPFKILKNSIKDAQKKLEMPEVKIYEILQQIEHAVVDFQKTLNPFQQEEFCLFLQKLDLTIETLQKPHWLNHLLMRPDRNNIFKI
ncbi:MAG: hypothetical protein JO131_07715 [Gammaproteobacteria bacterium]|nr:hypothetical protein [Gammaproteobacteria bacterium]